MVRYFMKISYIGTKYRGTQKCHEFFNETVQGAIESALSTLNPINAPLTSFASRTDKGVHALMNTLHVDLEHRRQGEVFQSNIIRRECNRYLKEYNHEIVVNSVCAVHPTFHARHLVKWRSYRYRLAILKPETGVKESDIKPTHEEYLPISLLNRCHVVPSDLDTNVVKDAVDVFCGSHDFGTFSKYTLRDFWKTTKRVVYEFKFHEVPVYNCVDDPLGSNISVWEFYVKSTSFLYHQVRKMVGSALAAGFGKLSVAEVKSMLDKPDPSSWTSDLAPACGLYLSHLHYDKEAFVEKDLQIANAQTEKLQEIVNVQTKKLLEIANVQTDKLQEIS